MKVPAAPGSSGTSDAEAISSSSSSRCEAPWREGYRFGIAESHPAKSEGFIPLMKLLNA